MFRELLKRLFGPATPPIDPVCNWQLTFITDGPTPTRDLGQVRGTASDALSEAIKRHARTLDHQAPHIIVRGAYKVTPAETVIQDLGYTYRIRWSPPENAFIATCDEFPYFKCHGNSHDEAFKDLQDIVELESEMISAQLGNDLTIKTVEASTPSRR
jgi:predicted RNase H-like HicB family nuclease